MENQKEKRTLRQHIVKLVRQMFTAYLRKVKGMEIGVGCTISPRVVIDRLHPRGVHIGNYTRIAAEAMVLSHDFQKGNKILDTRIGSYCVIGSRTIICPGVTLGDHILVGAGSVVTKSFEGNCIIAGNPAKMIKTGTILNEKSMIVNIGVPVKK